MLLRAFALGRETLLADVRRVIAAAPLRRMPTPGGRLMSVSMSNCGALGWISDRRGYRYSAEDPASGQPWPEMPTAFRALAREASAAAGFAGFEPDACLVNEYLPGTRLSLHQDADEQDYTAPIVSVSLGVPAVFLLGGLERRMPVQRVQLQHGDVLVWGGPARLRYHGVMPLAVDEHPLLGQRRINLTFRKAA